MKYMTMMQHFAELRRRILWTLGLAAAAFFAGWFVAPYVQSFLTSPLMSVWPDGAVLYTGLSDGLMIRLSLSMLVAMVVTMPVALWQAWCYVAPGLRVSERRFIWPIIILSPVLFAMGAAFAFYILFPFVFRFFLELNQSAPVPAMMLPAARDYLAFAIGLLKVFGIAFQLPLVMVMLNRIGVLSRSRVIKMRRYAIVLIVIIAAVLTPPDIVSQILLAVPMIILFEAGIVFMRRDD